MIGTVEKQPEQCILPSSEAAYSTGSILTMPSTQQYQEIACQQAVMDDSSVFSIQWSILPLPQAGSLTPEQILARYLAYIRQCTIGIIRPVATPAGMEFRIAGSGCSLITFLPPVLAENSITLRICGGLLVQRNHINCGEFRFGTAPDKEGLRISLELNNFRPSILGASSSSFFRYWLYRLTQAFIHRMVTIRFLASLYLEICGISPPLKVINISLRDGRPL